MKKPISPWTPVNILDKDNSFTISMWNREYTVDNDVLFTSIISNGKELLSSPIRLVGLENGEQIKWNEQSSFIMNRSVEKVTLCCSQESNTFIVNTALDIEYDGCCDIDIKIMPRGRTVAEVFGVDKIKPNEYSLDKLWLEIPLKKECANLFHYWPYYPASPNPLYNGEKREHTSVCMSREIPCSMTMPFKSLLWFGTEKQGLCWFAESDKNWEPADVNNAIEVIDSKDEVLVRFHLIDNTIKAWQPVGKRAKNYTYSPISFKMGLQATPVKPFSKNPYKEKILHIDCFKKVLEEYDEFLGNPVVEGSDEIGYDRMKRLGVTTLVIHEKWNKIQNYWELSEPTKRLAKTIVEECHKRGIKVIPYFGYEISSLNPKYTEYASSRGLDADGVYGGGWYRKPNQRAYRMCFNSKYADDMINGIIEVTKELDFDGVYLDGSIFPRPCYNSQHGCGFVDADGKAHATQPILATRRFLKKLYEFFEERDGIINTHISNCCNIPALSFAHINWDGEYIQSFVHENGINEVPLDYMRTEYSARHFGMVYEFLAYTFDNWSFKDSLSLGLIHGMLSRPNDIGEPLEIMSPIWKAVDEFDIENSDWKPYWENGIEFKDSSVKMSYYETKCQNKKFLVFIANPTDNNNQKFHLNLTDKPAKIFSVTKQCEVKADIVLNARESDVLIIE